MADVTRAKRHARTGRLPTVRPVLLAGGELQLTRFNATSDRPAETQLRVEANGVQVALRLSDDEARKALGFLAAMLGYSLREGGQA